MTDHPFAMRCTGPARRHWILAAACLLAAAGAAPASAGTLFLSPSVVAAYYTRPGPSGLEHLEILVLWRGRPNWYTQPSVSGSGAANLTGGHRYVSMRRLGGIDLSVVADLQRRTAEIQGRHTVDLRQHNVIFIDNVDDGSGGAIVRLLRIEAGLLATPGPAGYPILPVLRAAPEFAAFLRCGDAHPLPPGAHDFCAAILRP